MHVTLPWNREWKEHTLHGPCAQCKTYTHISSIAYARG